MQSASRSVLIQALSSMVCESCQRKARKFLTGLSTDELEYIAEFLGSCTLDAVSPCEWSRERLTRAIERFDRSRKCRFADREHKMILLLEYICRSTPVSIAVPGRAGSR